MKNPEERAADPSGVGGYKCYCCGPRGKGERKKWRRLVRRRMVAIFRKEFHENTVG